MRTLKSRGATLKATEQPIDYMLGVFAEFETNLRKGRQLEGIAQAKAAGVPVTIDPKAIADLKKQGLGARSSIYRLM